MKYKTILPHLKTQLKLNIRAKEKSFTSFNRGSISKELHNTHIKNLNELIEEYESVINKLNR